MFKSWFKSTLKEKDYYREELFYHWESQSRSMGNSYNRGYDTTTALLFTVTNVQFGDFCGERYRLGCLYCVF